MVLERLGARLLDCRKRNSVNEVTSFSSEPQGDMGNMDHGSGTLSRPEVSGHLRPWGLTCAA